MTSSKEYCCHDEEERGEQLRLRVVGIVVGAAIILILIAILLVWLILRPTKPRFILQDATVYAFNITQPNLLTTTFQVTISSRNPNERIGVYYERLDVFAVYRNQQITLPTRIPPNYEGHMDATLWSPFLTGNSVPVAPFLAQLLHQDLNAGLLLIHVKIDARLKWKVGTWVSGDIICGLIVPLISLLLKSVTIITMVVLLGLILGMLVLSFSLLAAVKLMFNRR